VLTISPRIFLEKKCKWNRQPHSRCRYVPWQHPLPLVAVMVCAQHTTTHTHFAPCLPTHTLSRVLLNTGLTDTGVLTHCVPSELYPIKVMLCCSAQLTMWWFIANGSERLSSTEGGTLATVSSCCSSGSPKLLTPARRTAVCVCKGGRDRWTSGWRRRLRQTAVCAKREGGTGGHSPEVWEGGVVALRARQGGAGIPD
jgi:hypothetical protein